MAASTHLANRLEPLRVALAKLSPTGHDGFKGLLAIVLEKIARQPFRLAKSGLQNGIDGETLIAPTHVSFEGKLYTNKIPDNEILTKITRLAGGANPPDLWVLGATVEAATQLLGPAQVVAATGGTSILVLDWPAASNYPPLAVGCAMAADDVAAFLETNLGDTGAAAEAKAALASMRAADDFNAHAEAIAARVRVASLSWMNAVGANSEWLLGVFSDRAKARAAFGQAVSPRAPAPMQHRQRPALTGRLEAELLAAPSRRIIALVGGEGRGKSWLAVDAWLAMEPRPLALFVPAADLKAVAAYGDFPSLLTGMIIRQTGEAENEENRHRWTRRLQMWKAELTPATPRLIVVVDGLNQHPSFDWPRWLDDAAAHVEKLGGVIVITVRKAFYDDRLRQSLNTPLTPIDVPEWSAAELNEILRERGIDPAKVAPEVSERLCNPRILSIAFSLLGNEQIQSFGELSVERLLFEHIRTSEMDGSAPENPREFARRLAHHAREVMDRVEAQRADDRLVFDPMQGSDRPYILSDDLLAVTAEHFFHPLPDDPSLYTLSQSGLSLALGLAIVSALKAAERNGRGAPQALAQLLEPVSALDMTAEAMFSALMAASIDDHCPPTIKEALMIGFLGLQNADERLFPPFVNVVRNSPEEAMTAMTELAASGRHVANKDWLSATLRRVRDDPTCRPVIARNVDAWLRRYSRNPAVGVFTRRSEDAAKHEQEKAKRADTLSERFDALPEAELAFLRDKMTLVDEDPAPLHEEALQLLAGRELAPFAEALVACAVSQALNSGHNAPDDEFSALIRFNRIDWGETLDAMLAASAFLRREDASRSGQWAQVQLLRAWSREQDALEAEQLVTALTADREKFEGWRLVEDWFASDPCDPASEAPPNAKVTAQKYADIEVGDLTKGRWMGSEDHFLRDARPGMARFAPDLAVAKHREFAASMLTRAADVRRLGVTSFQQHSPLLDDQLVGRMLDTAKALSSPRLADDPQSREVWVTSQYAILSAFPHLSGDAQLDFLGSLRPHGPPLLQFADVLRPAAPARLEAFLEQAAVAGDVNQLQAALMFVRHSSTELTAGARAVLAGLIEAKASSVRSLVFDAISDLGDDTLITKVVDSGWTAAALDARENRFERFYGSLVIIEGVARGFCSRDTLLDRIIPELWGHAAKKLGLEVGVQLAERLAAAIRRAIDIDLPSSTPRVLQREPEACEPALYELEEPEPEKGPEAFFKRLGETDEEYDRRQKGWWEAFRAFERTLTKTNARIIIEDVGSSAIEAFLAATPKEALALAATLNQLEKPTLLRLTNFVFRLASKLSYRDLDLARWLFKRVAHEDGVIRIRHEISSVSLEALSIWRSALADLQDERLDTARSDHQLAQEVNAALLAGKAEHLMDYARRRLQSPAPADNARAIMVLGYGAQNPFADEELNKPSSREGLLGKAREAARFAYDRDRWARHWFELMAQGDSPVEFWRHGVLFTKIVDGRFAVWNGDVERTGSAIETFGQSLDGATRRRIDAWKSKREKTLCGDNIPSPIFIVVDDD